MAARKKQKPETESAVVQAAEPISSADDHAPVASPAHELQRALEQGFHTQEPSTKLFSNTIRGVTLVLAYALALWMMYTELSA